MKINFKNLLFFCCYITFQGCRASSLADWVGKYPFDKINNKKADHYILDEKSKFKIPSQEKRNIRKLDVSDEISVTNGYAFVQKCMPHNCPAFHAIIIEGPKGKWWVGFYEENESFTSTRWYGSDDHTKIPSDISDMFMKSHAPK